MMGNHNLHIITYKTYYRIPKSGKMKSSLDFFVVKERYVNVIDEF